MAYYYLLTKIDISAAHIFLTSRDDCFIKNYVRFSEHAALIHETSVPDPPDPHVFGPPGSGSISQSMDPDPDPYAILLSTSKNRKKNVDSYCFLTSFGL